MTDSKQIVVTTVPQIVRITHLMTASKYEAVIWSSTMTASKYEAVILDEPMTAWKYEAVIVDNQMTASKYEVVTITHGHCRQCMFQGELFPCNKHKEAVMKHQIALQSMVFPEFQRKPFMTDSGICTNPSCMANIGD